MAKQSLLEMLLPTPDQIVRSYLTTDENLVLVDRPSTNALIVEASRQLILFAIIVLLLVAWSAPAAAPWSPPRLHHRRPHDLLPGPAPAGWYVRYVLTDSGWCTRGAS
jgi:hypothetical protein